MKPKNGTPGGSGAPPPPPPAQFPEFSLLPPATAPAAPARPAGVGAAKVLIGALAGVLVVGGLGLGAVLLFDPFGMKDPPPVATAPTVTVTSTQPAPAAPVPGTPTPTPTPVLQQPAVPTASKEPKKTSPPPGPHASVALEDRHAQDRDMFGDSLMGSFAVQLASARMGTEDEAFLAKYERISAAHPVYLTTTDDFYNRRNADDFFWVLFYDQGFETRAEANGWCADQGMGVDDCVAREIKEP